MRPLAYAVGTLCKLRSVNASNCRRRIKRILWSWSDRSLRQLTYGHQFTIGFTLFGLGMVVLVYRLVVYLHRLFRIPRGDIVTGRFARRPGRRASAPAAAMPLPDTFAALEQQLALEATRRVSEAGDESARQPLRWSLWDGLRTRMRVTRRLSALV